MRKGVFIGFLLVFSLGFVIAGDNETGNRSDGSCDDYCNDFWSSAMPSCPGDYIVGGEYPDCDCDWVCDEQNDTDYDTDYDEIYKGYEDEKLRESAGTKPGSVFYFIDKFFDRFGDEITVKEERIAEIKELIEEGDIETAKEVLKDYMKLAEELEQEVNPERKEDVLRSAAAIRNAMKDIRDELPAGERGKFVSEIMSQEHSIAVAAEIAGKIKELCTQLAELDPLEYSRMCKTDDDAPRWQKKLDKDLTEEQEKVARKFVGIMKDCFKTSGQDCRCGEIPFPDFADACSEAAPLATACDIENDERACDKLDDLDMPELPDWLQDIWEDLEDDMDEAQFDMHMPRECVEAGVTNPRECGKIMIEANAPEECKEALLAADVQSEREGRRICDEIMMKKHAPDCVEKGITDPEECRDFMDSFMDDFKEGERDSRYKIDFNCKEIKDPMERLDCFDKASSQAEGYGGFDDEDYEGNCMTDDDWKAKKDECKRMYGEHSGDEPIYGDSGDGYGCVVDAKCIDFSQGKMSFDDIREKEKECADDCDARGGRWDFSYGDCKCYFDDYGDNRDGGDYEEGSCDDCSSKCESRSGERLQGTDCVNGRCECYYESDESQYGDGESPAEPSIGDYRRDSPGFPGLIDYSGEDAGEEGDSGSGGSDSDSSDDGSSGGSSDSVDAGITGNVFLDYMYN